MKFTIYNFGAILFAISIHSEACSISLQDNIQLPLNSVDVTNRDRLALTRHYLTARDWTAEGARADVEAAAFDSEVNPKGLAASRGRSIKAFLMQLGLDNDDIYVHERVIKLNEGKIDPDDKWQIGVDFVPKCPSSGCQILCNTPKLQGVVAYAVTTETPGPTHGSVSFTCGDKREPTNARILRSEQWTEHTEEKTLTLMGHGDFGKTAPLAGICYRITTSAYEYIGMTDGQGRTARMLLLGPEYTEIEMKVNADRYGVSGGY